MPSVFQCQDAGDFINILKAGLHTDKGSVPEVSRKGGLDTPKPRIRVLISVSLVWSSANCAIYGKLPHRRGWHFEIALRSLFAVI